jgi:acetyl esterase
MTLHPQAQAIVTAAINSGRPPLYQLPNAAAARQQFKQTRGPLMQAPPEVAAARDFSIPGPGGAIPVRAYRPLGSQPQQKLPALVYFHGGGWVVGDLDTHDPLCRQLANDARCAVISVDYRLAPEHKFPAAVDDALATIRHVAENAGVLAIDASRLAVGGDSAGGNLAAVAAIALRDDPNIRLRFQLLIYPVTDCSMEQPSYAKLGKDYLLTNELMRYFADQYLRGPRDVSDWRASPLKAEDLAGLPPALVAAAGFDPLVDEGKAYADRLTAAGVPTAYKCYEDMIHGFFIYGAALETTAIAVSHTANALAEALR